MFCAMSHQLCLHTMLGNVCYNQSSHLTPPYYHTPPHITPLLTSHPSLLSHPFLHHTPPYTTPLPTIIPLSTITPLPTITHLLLMCSPISYMITRLSHYAPPPPPSPTYHPCIYYSNPVLRVNLGGKLHCSLVISYTEVIWHLPPPPPPPKHMTQVCYLNITYVSC